MQKNDIEAVLSLIEKKDRSSRIRYAYYLSGVEKDTPEDLENYFNYGLPTWYYSFDGLMERIDEKKLEEKGLESSIKDFAKRNSDSNSVLLIKIPADYLAIFQKSDNTIEPPLPLFTSGHRSLYGLDEMLFTHHLIRGCYNKDSEEFIENPNFCPVFDPKGFKYSKEQIDNLAFLNVQDWLLFAQIRMRPSFDDVYGMDIKFNKYENEIKYYMDKYKINPTSNTFNSSNYKNSLEDVKQKRLKK